MTSRDRLVITIVATLVAIAAAWLLVIQPSAMRPPSSAARSARPAAARQRADPDRHGPRRPEHVRQQLQGRRSARRGVPSDDNVPSLIYQLQNAASKAGGRLQDPEADPDRARRRRRRRPDAPSSTSTPREPPPRPRRRSCPRGRRWARRVSRRCRSHSPSRATSSTWPISSTGSKQFVVATNKHVSISGRLMTLNAISLGAATQGFPHITATISATTYLVPPAQGVLNGGTPSAPAGSGTQSASGSSSPVPVAPATATPPTP